MSEYEKKALRYDACHLGINSVQFLMEAHRNLYDIFEVVCEKKKNPQKIMVSLVDTLTKR